MEATLMTESKGIAVFPWWHIDQAVTLGPVRLLPYVRGSAPGDQEHAMQQDLDGVISAYALRPKQSVKKCTLLEVDDWRIGQDPNLVLRRLFAAQEAIGFASLAARELFAGHFGYCCFDNFHLVVQRYRAGQPGTFSFNTRRRDGGARYLWSSDDFAFQRPLHVDRSLKPPTPETALVKLLMDPTTPRRWTDAVIEFNHANTDSSDMPSHVELVMIKSAFELLFDCGERVLAFENALDKLLTDLPESPIEPNGSLRNKWEQAFPKATRPIHAWAREFCLRRGAAAHQGRATPGRQFVWSEDAHLAFASVLFPLALKRVAFNTGVFQMAASDIDRLGRIEEYLMEDPMLFEPDLTDDYRREHPWREIEADIKMRAFSRDLRDHAMNALDLGIQEVDSSQGTSR